MNSDMNFNVNVSITAPIVIFIIGYILYIISAILLIVANKRTTDYRNQNANVQNASDNLYIAQIMTWVIFFVPLFSVFFIVAGFSVILLIILATLVIGIIATILVFTIRALNDINSINSSEKDDILPYLIGSVALTSLSLAKLNNREATKFRRRPEPSMRFFTQEGPRKEGDFETSRSFEAIVLLPRLIFMIF